MIIINVRSFPGFQLTILKKKHTFMKNVVLYTTTLMHCKARQVLRDLFRTYQQNLWQELLKLTSKIWKPSYNWRFTRAYKLNTSNSSLQILATNWQSQLDKIFLTHFMPLISFDIPWKHRKSSGFFMFSGVLKEISDMKWVNTYDGIPIAIVPIAVLLPMQQFHITKMMMLIFSITVMCPYLYSVCLIYRVFKENLSVVASKYRICDTENNTREFKLCLNIAPMEKAWFMAPME